MKKATNLLIILNAIIIIAGGVLMPLWAKFVLLIGGDLRTAGNAIAIFSIVIGVMTYFISKLEHKMNADGFFLVFSAIIICLSYAGYFFVKHPWQLYLVQASLGIGCAFQTPVLYTLYQYYMPADKATIGWGLWNGVYNISIGIAALTGAYLAHHFGFTQVFSAMLALAICSLMISSYVAYRFCPIKL